MEVNEFERLLKLGLGRTIIHLQNHDSAPYRECILNACLHTISFDPQIEGFKTKYLMDIIDLTDERDFYREAILKATADINEETSNRDANHLVELTSIFAQEDDTEARKVIYDVYLENLEDEDSLGPGAIIEIDELDGFIFIAEKLWEIKKDEGRLYDSYLLSLLEDKLGESTAKQMLTEVRQANEKVDEYLKLVESYRNRPSKRSQNRIAYGELKEKILSNDSSYTGGWGKRADEESLREAAGDLLEQQEPKHLTAYLQIFSHRAFPLDPHLLFPLVQSDIPRVSALTFRALENVRHPAVREFALQLIENNEWVGKAVGLLDKNFHEGDWNRIEEITSQSHDEETMHDLQSSVLDIVSHHHDTQAVQSLLNLYEYGPCSFCREHIVFRLSTLNAIPEHIQAECFYDSNEDIRKFAENGFKDIHNRFGTADDGMG